MENVIVYGAAALCAVSLLPVYVSVYAYADSAVKYASANVCLYRFMRIVNMNTAEDGHMQMNGKDLKINPARAVKGGKAILDNLCLFKLIQLSDFGLKGEACAYGAIAQSAITLPLYKYLELSGSACKLRNYVILNREHGDVKYCAKAVAVINFVAAIKIILMLIMEKDNEN